MFTAKKNKKEQYQTSAKVVDSTLILSLPDALTPIVWRWDLKDVKASALEVRANENDGYTLILKTPRGDVQDVAPFETKDHALHALMSVSQAMESMPVTTIKTATAVSGSSENTEQNKGTDSYGIIVMAGIASFALIGILMIWLGSMQPQRMDLEVSADTATPTTTESNAGVPMSADDFLSGL